MLATSRSRRATFVAVPLALLVAGLALPSPVHAEKWGEFTREELFATHFDKDPEAGAVILLDDGVIRVDPKFRLKVRHHRRTKIFSEEGASRAVVRIPYGRDQEIKNFRAQTVVPPGKTVRVEKKHVSEERVGDFQVRVVTFPDVKPGVILEYEYELRSDDIQQIAPWHFQQEDHVREARLEMRLPIGMTYDAFFGWTPEPPRAPTVKSMNDPENPQFELQQSKWVLRDLPPLRPVPLQHSPADARTTLYIQLTAYDASGKKNAKVVQLKAFESGNERNLLIARPWKELAGPVSETYASYRGEARALGEWAKRALSEATTPAEKAKALYGLVRDSIRSIDAGSGFANLPDAGSLVADGAGSPAAKNLLMLALLEEHGIDAKPVLISTREHGTFYPKYHSIEQLNHVIARVTLGSKSEFLDAGNPFNEYGSLPPADHVEEGLLLGSDEASVIPIRVPRIKSARKFETEAELDRSGNLLCRSKLTFTGYEALRTRRALAESSAAEFVASLFEGRFAGARIGSVRANGLDPGTPLAIEVEFQIEDYAKSQGYNFSCGYPFGFDLGTGTLPDGERRCPIDFPYAWTAEEKVTMTLPPGFFLAESPPSATQSIGDLTFSANLSMEGRQLKARRKLRVRQPTLEGRLYADLLEFYENVETANEPQLLLKKRPMGASSG